MSSTEQTDPPVATPQRRTSRAPVVNLAPITSRLDALTDALGQVADTLLAILRSDDAEPLVPRWGQAKVAQSGHAVSLGSAAIQVAVVQALKANSAVVVIGDQSISQTAGFELQAGQAVGVLLEDISQLSVNGTAGDGVCWLGS